MANRFIRFIKSEDNSVNEAMREAIERCKKAAAEGVDPQPLDFHSDFDELELPKKPLFSFGEKALSKIAGTVRRTPNTH